MWYRHPNALVKIEYVKKDFSRETHEATRLVEYNNINEYINTHAPTGTVLYRYSIVSCPSLRPGTWMYLNENEYIHNRFVDTILDGDRYVVPVTPEEIPPFFDADKALALLTLDALGK